MIGKLICFVLIFRLNKTKQKNICIIFIVNLSTNTQQPRITNIRRNKCSTAIATVYIHLKKKKDFSSSQPRRDKKYASSRTAYVYSKSKWYMFGWHQVFDCITLGTRWNFSADHKIISSISPLYLSFYHSSKCVDQINKFICVWI